MAQGKDRTLLTEGPAGRAERVARRDSLLTAVTGGDAYGTSGVERQAFWRAFALISGLMVAICSVNVLTVVHDRARDGHPIATWEPAVWESTSGLCILLCILLLYPILLWALRRWPRWAALTLLCGLPAFSVLHVSGMVLARRLIYRLVGETYGFTVADFPYEFRKDAVAYALLGSVLWLWRRAVLGSSTDRSTQLPAAMDHEQRARTFDIREGTRTLRVPLAEMVAVRSAGNYVEIILADGRTPLMRSTLAALAHTLEPEGFVRTHRSWLVNAAQVRIIEPEGSGDYAVELEGGRRAPLSRRFPQALTRLR